LSGSRENNAKRLGYTALSYSYRKVAGTIFKENAVATALSPIPNCASPRMLCVTARSAIARKTVKPFRALFGIFSKQWSSMNALATVNFFAVLNRAFHRLFFRAIVSI
jgi:hypothetical protein